MASHDYPEYECQAKPWPLPNHITKSICLLAGREASAILRIALGKHTGAIAAHEATYYEPFTYWDWHGVPPNDTYARKWKRQRIWEYNTSFTVNDRAFGYPTPRERWEAFKSNVGADLRRTQWVKKIAVANWMDLDDMRWIATNFIELEGLDLSDLSDSSALRQGVRNNWIGLLEDHDFLYDRRLSCLMWLGLPDFRHPCERFALDLVQQLLPRCRNLQALSIRQNRTEKSFGNAHEYVCKLPLTITKYAPRTVTSLELRLVLPIIDRLVHTLRAQRSPIKRIGIDFGAWVQKYSRQQGAPIYDLGESEIRRAAHSAAKKLRFETYEAHNDALGAGERWRLPESHLDEDGFPDSYHYGAIDASHGFEKDFYRHTGTSDGLIPELVTYRSNTGCLVADDEGHEDDVNNYLTDMDVSSLSALLNQLYTVGTTHRHFTLFALEPEWQEKSTDPVHPLALIEDCPTKADKKVNQVKLASFAAPQPLVYQWINATFHWRPVFDWNSFIDSWRGEVNGAYTELVHRRNADTHHPKLSVVDKLVAEVAKQFEFVKYAGIPIHIRVGRRDPDHSSLYWGWPLDEASWADWLKEPIDAEFKPIAPFISTLTVMYDLRNPLDEDRLQAIDKLSFYKGTIKPSCPRPVCPWAAVNRTCPFPKDSQWPRSTPQNISYQPQKRANKQSVKMSTDPLPPLGLATNHSSLPPTGHHVVGFESDEQDNLHVRARNAAFMREAVGWQRFWATYASHLTDLQVLNVRMPKVFDGTGSIKLARLLDSDLGWEMKAFADEAGLYDSPYYCKETGSSLGEKIWPAGTFVRRTWVKLPPNAWNGKLKKTEQPKALNRGEEDEPDFSDAEDEDDSALDEREKEELAKSLKRASNATEEAAGLESELYSQKAIFEEEESNLSGLEHRLKSKYGRTILRIAKHAWQERVKHYGQELKEHYSARAYANETVKDVLKSTRDTLLAKAPFFKPEYVFKLREGELRKDDIVLVEYERNYASGLRARRGYDDQIPDAKALERLRAKREAETAQEAEEEDFELFGSPELIEIDGAMDQRDYEEGEDVIFLSPEGTVTDDRNALAENVQEPEAEDDEDLYGSPPPSPFRRDPTSNTLISVGLPILRDYSSHIETRVQNLPPVPVVEPPAALVPNVGASVEALLATLKTYGRPTPAQPPDGEEDFYGTTEVQQTVEVEETRVCVSQVETTYVHVEESMSTTEATEEVEQPQEEHATIPELLGIESVPVVEQPPAKKSSLKVPEQRKEPAPPPKEPKAPASVSVSKEPAPSKMAITPLKLVAPIIHKEAAPAQAEQPTAPPKKPTLAHVEPVKPKSSPTKKSQPTTKSAPTKVDEPTPQTQEPVTPPVEPSKAEPATKRKASETPLEEHLAKRPALPSVEQSTPRPAPKKPIKPKKAPPRPKAPVPDPTTPAPQAAPSHAPPSPPPTKKRAPRKRKDPVLADAGNLTVDITEKRVTRSRSGTPAKVVYKEASDDEEEKVEVKKKGGGKGKKRATNSEYMEKREVKRRKQGKKKGE